MTRPVGADVGTTVREMWETRPSRRADDRKIAGVAGGIARRYAIDPTLVRIGFVVAAFYGVGLLVYLLGWLVLPAEDAAGARRTRPHPVAIAAAVVVGLIALGPLAGGEPRTAVGLLVVSVLLFALHRGRSRMGTLDRPAAGPLPVDEGVGVGVGDPGVGADGERRPPSWDPLGAAPFAWDLPDPSTPPPPPEPRSPITPITLALALVAGGLVGALGLVGVLPLGITPVVGTALAVVGLGLVVGAFGRPRGRGRGLIIAAVPLALVLAAAASDGSDDDSGYVGPFGDRTSTSAPGSIGVGDGTWAPTSAAQVLPAYETGAGDASLDLRAVPAGQPVATSVRTGFGDAAVLVPATADVTAVCTTGVGDSDCLGVTDGSRVVDPGPDGPGGPVIDVRVTSGAGDVEVDRG